VSESVPWLRRHAPAAVVSLVAALLVTGCAVAPRPWDPWRTTLGRENPLAGQIWDVGAGRFVDADRLVTRLVPGRFVLLGEKHDNADHHRLQAWLLGQLIARGRRPAVGFEMFETTDAPAIARYLAAAPHDAAGLGDAVDWGRSGWPPWELYRPIAAAALEAGLPIVATNLPRGVARTLSRQGVAGVDPALAARLGLDHPLSPERLAPLATEIRDAHCGQIPESMLAGMVAAQRARDAQIARSLVEAATADGGLLIAGAGHVRTDRGVPIVLAALVPGARVLSVAFVEVDDDRRDPGGYAARFGVTVLPFDFVWFTPRVEDRDPCERFRTAPVRS
jgi:uncharacterized iron-regulated protein